MMWLITWRQVEAFAIIERDVVDLVERIKSE
jgi:hypothetical protein